MIPDEAVEAAARAMEPGLWDNTVWRPIFHGDRPSERRAKDQAEALATAREILEAAAPLMAAYPMGMTAAEWKRYVDSYR